MSFVEQFSIGYKLRKEKLKKTLDNCSEKQSKPNNFFRMRTYTRKGTLSASLAQKLVSLGYNIDSIMSLMKIHNFSNVEEALNLLEKDPVTKLYNHYFFPKNDDNSFLKRAKSEQLILKNRNKSKNKIETICRICGGEKKEHIEKDEYTQEITKYKKKYEQGQYYETESHCANNIPLIERDKMKINVIERVRTMGNNLNRNNRNLIFNLNNNLHKYYINSHHNRSNNNNINSSNNNNNDCSQNIMIFQNKKPHSGTNIDSILVLNHHKINNNNNKDYKLIDIHDTFEEKNIKNNNNEEQNNKINIEKKNNNNKTSDLLSDSKTEDKKDIKNEEKINEKHKEELINDIYQERNLNLNGIGKENGIDIEEILNEKLKKYGIKQETLKQFKDPNLCNICFENKINKENIAQKCCLHYFCDSCIKKYLTHQINNGIVLDIKCIMAGCPHLYTSEEIRSNVSNEIYRKYLRFYGIQIKLRNPEKTYINCPFVDCDELVDITNIQENNIICGIGHVFCKECLKIGGHSKANSICKKNELNLELFNELKQKNPSNIHQNYKQCPECKVLIEKNDGCNQMKCLNCGYSFCWLCLREYTYNHYSIYNVKGCPGMRFETVKTYKIRNNACLNFLWYMLSCFLYILFFICIYIFYLFAGCPYEFVKCYLERKKNKENDNKSNYDSLEIYDDNINEFGLGIGIPENGLNNSNQTNNANPATEEGKKNSKAIIYLLIFVGIICQPLYLAFYAIYTIIECYKRFNCMFYFPR